MFRSLSLMVILLVAAAALVLAIGLFPSGHPSDLKRLVWSRPQWPVPDIALTAPGDIATSPRDWRGRFVVLNLWATWCAPCLEELPGLDQLDSATDDNDITVLAVSVDRGGLGTALPFLEELGIRHLTVLSAPPDTPRRVHAPGLPLTLLIDREGREIARVAGKADWGTDAVQAFLLRLADAKGGPASGAADK